MDHFDVLIVGAGLSGIGAAVALRKACPGKCFVLLEGRSALGGTWDLFRYPGVRSDSDMHTLGYRFKPWRGAKAIADGAAILDYLRETARDYGIDRQIRYRHRVTAAAWSTADATWTVAAEIGDRGETVRLTCNFLFVCAGYYSYRRGYTPVFAGRERFKGVIVHPQVWPQDLDYAGKTIAVIGSGATAMTLVPALAARAAHVVMVQRSPTYVAARGDTDPIADTLRCFLPARWAYAATRWKNVALQQFLYRRSRIAPARVKAFLIDGVRKELGPGYDVATHFTPRYNPWDQRLCLVPNGDLFAAIRSGKVSVVTDRIAGFSETGVTLASGKDIAADIIVTATGLELVLLGETAVSVDGTPVDFATTWTHRGVMFSDVPNLAATFGYINASWTLRADLVAAYVCRLLRHMDRTGARQVTPRLPTSGKPMTPRPWIVDFSSGYLQRMIGQLPKQGDRDPWLNSQNYAREKKAFRSGPIDDGTLEFANKAVPAA